MTRTLVRMAFWTPVNGAQYPPQHVLTPIGEFTMGKTPKKRYSLTETDWGSPADQAIDSYQKSQSSIIVSLPKSRSFDRLVERVEKTMDLVNKGKICLADKANRRKAIARQLSERRNAAASENSFLAGKLPRCNTRTTKGSNLRSSPDQSTTKRSSAWTREPKSIKIKPGTTKQFSPMLQEMISECEKQSNNIRDEYLADCLPEKLVVENEYSPTKFKIVQVPDRPGVFIITNCRNADWMFDLGVRLDKEKRQRLSDLEKGVKDICDAVQSDDNSEGNVTKLT